MADHQGGLLDAVTDQPQGVSPPAPAEQPAEAVTEPAGGQEQEPAPPAKDGRKASPAADEARPEGYVPKQALEQARIEYREELKRERESRERAEANFQKFLDQYYAAQQPAQDDPDAYYGDPNDVTAKAEWAFEREQRRLAQERQTRQLTYQQQQQAAAFQQALAAVSSDYQAAVAADPTVGEAYNALYASYAQELQALGYVGPQIEQALNQLEAQHVMAAYQNRRPIGQFITQLAQVRGWRPGQAASANGQAGPGRNPDTGQFEKAQSLARSQERNMSLSQAPGGPVKKMTAKELGQMSEEDMWRHFGSVLGKPGAKEFDRDMNFR